MTTVTLTGTVMRAIRNVPITSARVRARLAAIFGEVPITYPTETSDPAYKVDGTGAINGAGIPVQVPTVASGNTAQWVLTFLLLDEEGEAEENSTLTMPLDDTDATVLLEDKAAGGTAGAGGEITVSGKVYHPFGDGVPYASGSVNVALVERFATEDGIYLAVNEDIKISLGDLNGGGGLVLYVPDGQSEWLFTFPDGSTATAYLGTHTNYVEIADIANGDYATALTPMDAPTAFSAVQDGVDVDLAWNDETADETLFRIERSDDDGATWEAVTTTAADAESYTDEGVPSGEYIYRIRAEKSAGQSAWVTDSVAVELDPPIAPSELALATTGTNLANVQLTWVDESGNETGFIVERSYNNSDWTELTTTAADIEAYTDTALDRTQTTIYYRVRAENAYGESSNTTANIAGWKVNTTFYSRLDEVSSNRTTVVSGMTLTDNNTVTSTTGKVGNAAVFVAANNEYLSGGDSAAVEIGAGDFTIAAWVRNISGGGSYQVALGKDDFPSSPREWAVFARFADVNELRLLLFDTGDSVVGEVATASLTLDTWYHVVFTRSGSTLSAYLNAGTPVTASTTGTPRSSSSAGFTVSAPSGAGNYNGYIDEVAIAVGRAWSAGQIADNYNAGNGTTY